MSGEKIVKIEGNMSASKKKFAIIAARWNEIFTARLLEGAIDALIRHGASESDITVVRVPGCFEIPIVAKELAKKGSYDAVITLGTLIKGETDHYQLIAGELVSGILSAMNETGVPITFGVLTANNLDQATARAGCKAGNKGWEAATAAIEMANVMSELRSKKS